MCLGAFGSGPANFRLFLQAPAVVAQVVALIVSHGTAANYAPQVRCTFASDDQHALQNSILITYRST